METPDKVAFSCLRSVISCELTCKSISTACAWWFFMTLCRQSSAKSMNRPSDRDDLQGGSARLMSVTFDWTRWIPCMPFLLSQSHFIAKSEVSRMATKTWNRYGVRIDSETSISSCSMAYGPHAVHNASAWPTDAQQVHGLRTRPILCLALY